MRPAKLPLLLTSCALLSLPGCALFTDAPHYRGVAVTQHDLNELTPGISGQADAQALLGPPSFVEQFDQNNWVYVAQVTKMRIANTEGVKAQNVVVLTFDNNGLLQSVSERGMKDAVKVAMAPGETPVPGGKAGFIKQLVGGVGSYSPLGSANDTSASGPAAGPGPDIGGTSGGSGF